MSAPRTAQAQMRASARRVAYAGAAAGMGTAASFNALLHVAVLTAPAAACGGASGALVSENNNNYYY